MSFLRRTRWRRMIRPTNRPRRGAGTIQSIARATADNPPRTTARTDATGNLSLSRAVRDRPDELKNDAAKAGGVSTGAAFLSLLAALLGSGLGSVGARGRKLGESLHLGRERGTARDRELGRTSTAVKIGRAHV